MDFVGLLRSMQPEIMGAMGFLVFITIVFVIVRKLSAHAVPEDRSSLKYWSRFCYIAFVVLTVVCLMWRGLELVVANRIPRSDGATKGSGVFDQMKQNQQRGQ